MLARRLPSWRFQSPRTKGASRTISLVRVVTLYLLGPRQETPLGLVITCNLGLFRSCFSDCFGLIMVTSRFDFYFPVGSILDSRDVASCGISPAS